MTRFNFLRTLLLTALIVAAAQTSVSADKDIQIINHTGRVITRLYFSPVGYSGIGFCGTEILTNDSALNVHCKGDYRYYGMRIVFADDEICDWRELDLDGVQRLIIVKSDKSGRYVVHKD